MIIATDHKPNFTQVISIEPDEMSDYSIINVILLIR